MPSSPLHRQCPAVALAALLVAGCDTAADADPLLVCPPGEASRVFDAFWRDLDQRYALFDLRLPGGDWTALGRSGCAALGQGATDEALFDALLDLARNLDDGHVQLEAEDLDRDEDGWATPYPHGEALEGLEANLAARYLDGPLQRGAAGAFGWGTLGVLGYLGITRMEDLSTSGSEEEDGAAARATMALVLADLAGAEGLVVDVRANGGGWDSVSLEIATWFAGPRTLAWQKQRRNGPAHDDFGPWEEVFVADATSGAFRGPVVLLTSGGTFSAAETFALAMRVRSKVSIVGERTSGHFSDAFEGTLPNGWTYTLSGERYRAADGHLYETLGVPVDTPVDLDPAALAKGTDAILEAALSVLATTP